MRRWGESVDYETLNGRTALMQAVLAGNVDSVQALMWAGVTVDRQNKDGFTALMQAVHSSRIDMVPVLVNKGERSTR